MDPGAKRPASPAPQMLDKGALKLEVTPSLVTGELLRSYKNTQGGPERNVMALDERGDLVFQGNTATARAALGVMQALYPDDQLGLALFPVTRNVMGRATNAGAKTVYIEPLPKTRCLGCGAKGHILPQCPLAAPRT